MSRGSREEAGKRLQAASLKQQARRGWAEEGRGCKPRPVDLDLVLDLDLLFGLRRRGRQTGTAGPCPCHAVLRARFAWGFGVWAQLLARGMGRMGPMGRMGHKSESRVTRHQEPSRWPRLSSLGGRGSVAGVRGEGLRGLGGGGSPGDGTYGTNGREGGIARREEARPPRYRCGRSLPSSAAFGARREGAARPGGLRRRLRSSAASRLVTPEPRSQGVRP